MGALNVIFCLFDFFFLLVEKRDKVCYNITRKESYGKRHEVKDAQNYFKTNKRT